MKARGFTLLEVMIALMILTLALTALLGHEGVAIQMSDYSNRVSQANLLAQGKMLDVQHKLVKDSMDIYDNCEEGDFRDEGFRRFKWKACAYKMEVGEGVAEQMTEQIMSMVAGTFGFDVSDMGSLDPKMQQMVGQVQMAIGAVPTFLQQLEDKVRKVRLEVTWKDAVDERVLMVERFVTLLGTDPKDQPPAADGKAMGVPGVDI